MIIGKVSSTPKNAYLRCDGKGFNSSLGAKMLPPYSYAEFDSQE